MLDVPVRRLCEEILDLGDGDRGRSMAADDEKPSRHPRTIRNDHIGCRRWELKLSCEVTSQVGRQCKNCEPDVPNGAG
jgi:hypothetical protein